MKKALARTIGRQKCKDDDELVLLESLSSNVKPIDCRLKGRMEKIRIDGIIKPFVSEVMPRYAAFIKLLDDADFLVIESMLGEDSMESILADEALKHQFALAIFHRFPERVATYKSNRAKYLKNEAVKESSNG